MTILCRQQWFTGHLHMQVRKPSSPDKLKHSPRRPSDSPNRRWSRYHRSKVQGASRCHVSWGKFGNCGERSPFIQKCPFSSFCGPGKGSQSPGGRIVGSVIYHQISICWIVLVQYKELRHCQWLLRPRRTSLSPSTLNSTSITMSALLKVSISEATHYWEWIYSNNSQFS